MVTEAMHENLIDVIIVNYNSTDYAMRCIGSVNHCAQSLMFKIIVVENGSKDSPGCLKQNFADIDLVRNATNKGFSKAVNQALRRSHGKYVVLLNPDAFIYNGLFKKVFNYLDNHPDVGIVGPRIIERDGNIQGSARRFPSLWTSVFGRKSPITRLFPNNPITRREFPCFSMKGSEPISVDWVSGACLVARREAVDRIGGFDERFFLYWEDADLCRRIKDAGWKIIYFPEAEVYHYTGCSSDKEPLASIFNFHKSSYLLLKKYATGPLKYMMPLALVALGVRCVVAMALNRFQHYVSKRR